MISTAIIQTWPPRLPISPVPVPSTNAVVVQVLSHEGSNGAAALEQAVVTGGRDGLRPLTFPMLSRSP